MGAYQQIYFGPYIRIPKLNGTITHEDKKCMTVSCISYKNKIKAKFCPNCGTPATIVPRTENIKKSGLNLRKLSDEQIEHWHDTFTFPHAGGDEIKGDYDYLLPQSSDDLIGVIEIDDNFIGGIDISNINTEEILLKFDIKYRTYIDKIKNDGGEPELCYGIFIHYA